MKRASKFSPEVRERAVRMVLEHRSDYPSQWATIESIAPKIGCTAQTLLNWVQLTEVDQGTRDGVNAAERQPVKALERDAKELRRANEILKLGSAFSPRRSSTADPKHERFCRLSPRHLWHRAHLQGSADCTVRLPSLRRPETRPRTAFRPHSPR